MATTSAPKLDQSVFGVLPKSHELLKQAYVSYLANGRENLAVTKTRGLVSGGGKKPWRQKGTGRARFGSTRNPIWRTGGIVFGPTGYENYRKELNTKAKRLAIRQALSLAAHGNAVKVVDTFAISDGKTKTALQQLTDLKVTGRTVIAVASKDAETVRATSNLPQTKLVQATYLNVFDVLNADTIVITKDALDAVSKWLGDDKETK